MKRRDFIRLSSVATLALLFPKDIYAQDITVQNIGFSQTIHNANSAQTLVIFLYGAASQLGGNITNIDAIKAASQSDYSYFRGITPTANECWQEAGGTHMEDLINNGDMTIFRTCYSHVREANNNKAHGLCTSQNQTGSFSDNRAGIASTLAQVLQYNGIIGTNSVMPFVTLEGDSKFYASGSRSLDAYLKPIGINENLQNPYSRNLRNRYYFYTRAERESAPDTYNKADTGFDPALHIKMDTLAQSKNSNVKIKNAFDKRKSLSAFVEGLKTAVTGDLGVDAYVDNSFARKVETSINVLIKNSDTRFMTLSTGSLGGWDDHNEARTYVSRMESLFRTLKSAMAHLKLHNKENEVNIMVFGEFGRNVNLNSAVGWDHGNLQNLYVLGGKGYFQHRGVVGETVLEDSGNINRLFLKPKSGSYEFEPVSIAATIYKLYGITNPEDLCDGYGPIEIF